MGARQSRTAEAATGQQPMQQVHPRYEKKMVSVLGKSMAYYEVTNETVELDSEDTHTIVFVHGNPTSSYMWRNVMPHCEGLGRLVAVDLIGMGESDKLVETGPTKESRYSEKMEHKVDRYSLKEQSRYFSAFLDAVGVWTNVTFVAHSWGGTLAAYWGSQNPHAVKGLVSLEVVYVPFPSWERVPKKIRGGVKLMLRPPFCKNCCYGGFDLGAHLILKKNLMLESMPERVNRKLSDSEMNYYRQPFTNPESRLPILAFIRSIPVAGEPGSVVEMMDAGRKWIESSESLEVLFLCVEPGTMTDDDRNCIRSWRNVTEIKIKGGHLATEDSAGEIGLAIAKWFREVTCRL